MTRIIQFAYVGIFFAIFPGPAGLAPTLVTPSCIDTGAMFAGAITEAFVDVFLTQVSREPVWAIAYR